MTSSRNLKCHQNLNAIENPPAPSRELGIAFCHGERRTRNEMHDRSFPVDTQIGFELIVEKIKFVVDSFVDIVLV